MIVSARQRTLDRDDHACQYGSGRRSLCRESCDFAGSGPPQAAPTVRPGLRKEFTMILTARRRLLVFVTASTSMLMQPSSALADIPSGPTAGLSIGTIVVVGLVVLALLVGGCLLLIRLIIRLRRPTAAAPVEPAAPPQPPQDTPDV